jgi:Tfp pilus assembly protein PilX
MRVNHLNNLTRPSRRRGVTALMAMLFLMLISVLALTMFHVASNNVQTSVNYSDLARAHAAAESGLRWTAYRFVTMTRPRDMAGSITPAIAVNLWTRSDGMRDRLAANMAMVRDQKNAPIGVVSSSDTVMTTTPVPTDLPGATFSVSVRQLGPSDFTGTVAADQRFVRVISTGRYRNAMRSVSMDFEIVKRAKFAVVGKVPIQIGRNTIIEGPIGMTTASKYPPVLILSDFMHFHDGLKTKITDFNTYLRGTSLVNGQSIKNHNGFDNRVSVNNAPEYTAALKAGYKDVNGDAFIDEYDLFVNQFDTNKDGQITRGEFTNPSTGKLYDEQLFATIDGLSPPMFNEDVNGNGYLDSNEDNMIKNGRLDVDPARSGFRDGVIDDRDHYEKIAGPILVATTANSWQSAIGSGGKVADYIQGPIAPPETGQQAIKFGATEQEMLDLDPQNFEQAAANFRNKTGPAAGVTSRVVGRIENAVLTPADATAYSPPHVTVTASGGTGLTVGSIIPKSTFDSANATATSAGKSPATSTAAPATVDDKAPFGSTSYQATFRRPIFRGVAFKNVQIPKGINALFENCTFEGVTFVDVERNVTSSGGSVSTSSGDGMSFAQRMKSGTFSKDTVLTSANSYGFVNGNNLRFNNCVFEGPISSNYATAYTHFANSWEFTGSTMFNNKVDQTATLVAPQTNIEMGSFTDPLKAPSTLVGVVVAGNLDIRGTSIVDGSIIITGDGAGNTTLGYFGASDGDTSTAVDLTKNNGGWGRLHIHYNPYRVMPDGINLPVDFAERLDTYREGTNR